MPLLTNYENIVGEHRMMSIYAGEHLMEFVRADVQLADRVESLDDDEVVAIADCPVARRHRCW